MSDAKELSELKHGGEENLWFEGFVVDNLRKLSLKIFRNFQITAFFQVQKKTSLSFATQLSTLQNLSMQNQTIEGGKVVNGKQTTSKEVDIQTDLVGDEVEKLRSFHDKYLEKQLKLDVNLR